MRLDLERLRQLCSLQSRPIGTTFRGVLASVMLDRLALTLAALFALAMIVLLARRGPLAGYVWHAVAALVVLAIAAHFYLAAGRGSVSPAKHMTDRAARIAALFRAPYIVMGHTHVPVSVRAGEATYINVGSWSEEADPASAHRAARTHAVIHEREDGADAALYEWHPEQGPRLRS
jgi:UDP-2,3-diacylglucosamine pyrophosphatase LpxH